MTVQELIDDLSAYPMDCQVIIQEDSEGNGYHSAYTVDLTYDDEDQGYPSVNCNIKDYYEDDAEPSKKRVVVIV